MTADQVTKNPFSVINDNGFSKYFRTSQYNPLKLAHFYFLVGETIKEKRLVEIGTLLERSALQKYEWKEFVSFHAFRYTRSLVSFDQNFSIMICCWNHGQTAPVQYHGSFVQGWVKVLNGSIKLKRFTDDSEIRNV